MEAALRLPNRRYASRVTPRRLLLPRRWREPALPRKLVVALRLELQNLRDPPRRRAPLSLLTSPAIKFEEISWRLRRCAISIPRHYTVLSRKLLVTVVLFSIK